MTTEEPIARYHDHRTIDERFATFDADYPQVYRMIVGFARMAHRRGFQHYGIQAIVERARWEVSMRWGPDTEGFKLNNDFTALYARKVMAENPDLDGFFRLRRRRSLNGGGAAEPDDDDG